jgi:AraC-like DNA-binding protein
VCVRWSGAADPDRLPLTERLARARQIIDARYVEPLDVAALADAARLSRAHFSREFRRAFGVPPHRYLTTRRMHRAAALLRSTDYTVARICRAVGLRSVGSFTTRFGQTFGMPPTAYRSAASLPFGVRRLGDGPHAE